MKKSPESAAVVKAIQKLKQTRGVTVQDIICYITTTYRIPESQVRRQMYAVLKKGVNCGFLSQNRGYYRLAIDNSTKNMVNQLIAANLKERRKIKKVKRLRKYRKRRLRTKKQKC